MHALEASMLKQARWADILPVGIGYSSAAKRREQLMKKQWLNMILCSGGIAAVVAGAESLSAFQQTQVGGASNHVVLTSQQDRQRVMDQLKITLFPSGPGAYLASTYDENTANPYPNLPDPLTLNNGTKVTSAARWRQRRTEIVELFDREVYGRRPGNIPKVTWTVGSTTDTMTGAVPMVTKQLVGRVDNSRYPALNVTILATLSTPRHAMRPVPVVLMFGGGGALPEGVPATTPCGVPGTLASAAQARAGGPPPAGRAGAAGRGGAA